MEEMYIVKKKIYEAKTITVRNENQYAQERLKCQQQLLQAKTNTETTSSNLAFTRARSAAKKEDSTISETTLNLLFPLVFAGSNDETNKGTSTVANNKDNIDVNT